MLSQIMLFSFPFVFVRHQGLAVQLVEMIMVIEIKVFGKANVQVLCMRSMSRLFYKLSFKIFLFP